MSSNKTIKLLLQRRKNRPETKACFLLNILETIADNLSALIEFTPIQKNKSVKLPFVGLFFLGKKYLLVGLSGYVMDGSMDE